MTAQHSTAQANTWTQVVGSVAACNMTGQTTVSCDNTSACLAGSAEDEPRRRG